MAVKAPFRFIRINRWVHEPVWGELTTHDIPFFDGLSGTANLTLKAITPLLVGGERVEAAIDSPGEIHSFKVNQSYAIPQSSMQGMCRAILETAGFGRLGSSVEDRKFGIRDLSRSETGKVHYQSRLSETSGRNVTPNSLAGFLQKSSDGKIEIIPCKFSRIHVDDVWDLRNQKLAAAGQQQENGQNPFYRGGVPNGNADKRYSSFLQNLSGKDDLNATFKIDEPAWHPHARGAIQIYYSRCKPATGDGTELGVLVLTGKPSHGIDGPGKKKWEFVFHNRNLGNPLTIDDKALDAFSFIHGEQARKSVRDEGSQEPSNPNWAYWKREFDKYKPVPVFYWSKDEKTVDTFGMAFAFKAAHVLSTHDMLRNSHPKHIEPNETAKLDLAHLIFGVKAESEKGQGLKRRVWFGLGRSDSKEPELDLGPAILLGPKPSYAGIYVRQVGNQGKTPRNEPQATYTPVETGNNIKPHLKNPELAGVKVVPATNETPCSISIETLTGELAGNKNVQSMLHPVPHGTEFTTPMTFHNLRPVELGALLWALSFGSEDAFKGDVGNVKLRHRLGMGKALGLGEIAISVGLDIDGSNDSGFSFVKEFEVYMNNEYPEGIDNWEKSVQIKALQKSADPTQNNFSELKYMNLGSYRDNGDTYLGEKNSGGFLTDYVDGHELRKPSASAARPPDVIDEDPVIGARIRFAPATSMNIRNKEGVIKKISGNAGFEDFLVAIDGIPKWTKHKKNQFMVIALPA